MFENTREIITDTIGNDGMGLVVSYYIEQINAGYKVDYNYIEKHSRDIAKKLLLRHQNYQYHPAGNILAKRVINEYEELAQEVESVLKQEIKMELSHYANSYNTALKRLENKV